MISHWLVLLGAHGLFYYVQGQGGKTWHCQGVFYTQPLVAQCASKKITDTTILYLLKKVKVS
jgi:hypothetical protein